MSEVIFGAVFLAVFAALMPVIHLIEKKGLAPETSRKLMHISSGVLAAALPFFVKSRATVLILCAIAFSGLLVIRLAREKLAVSGVLYGVGRDRSLGELLFPVSIALIYTLTGGGYQYVIPMLILAFSDSMSALVGISYGRKILSFGDEDKKSIEGTVIFFFVTFVCAVAPLLLMTTLDRAATLLIPVCLGILISIVELSASFGLDNLLIPFLAFVFLNRLVTMNTAEIAVYLGVFLVILIAALPLLRRKSNISSIGMAELILVFYIFLMVGGAGWAAALVLMIFIFIFPSFDSGKQNYIATSHIVETNMAFAVLAICVASIGRLESVLYYVFWFLLAGQMAANSYVSIRCFVPKIKRPLLFSFVKTCLVMLPACVLIGVFFYGYGIGAAGILSLPAGLLLNLFLLKNRMADRIDQAKMSVTTGVMMSAVTALTSLVPLAAICLERMLLK